MANARDREALLSPPEVAEELRVSVGHLGQMRYLGTGPRYLKMGGKAVRYRRSDIDAWIEANMRTSTGAA